MYEIFADMANHRLAIDFVGSYTDIDFAAFARDLRAAALRVKGAGAHFDLLVDYTAISVMPKDRTAAARDEVEWCMANGLRRSANVVSSAISRMQLERLTDDARFGHFTSRADAIAWLRAPG